MYTRLGSVFFSLMLFVCSGCSSKSLVRDRSQDYHEVECQPSLKLPKHLQAVQKSSEYQIP